MRRLRLRLKSRLRPLNNGREPGNPAAEPLRYRRRLNSSLALKRCSDSGLPTPVPLTVASELSNKCLLMRKQRPTRRYCLSPSGLRAIHRPAKSPWRGVPSSSLRNPCRSQQQLARGLCTPAHSTVYRWTPCPHPANVFLAGLMKTVSKQRHVRKRPDSKPSDQRPVTGDRSHKSGSGLESGGHHNEKPRDL